MKIKAMIRHPRKLVYQLGIRCGFPMLNDEQYIKLMCWSQFGKIPDLNSPKTFNEKIQWLKLHDHNPEYTKFVDKYVVKKYVSDMIGEKYIIPILGVWDNFDEIDFDTLPEQFVLKCTHDSGGLVICKDKSKLDRYAAKKKLENSLKRNYYLITREWPYKDVKPRIIAEKYMVDSITQELQDYKFYCFHGEPCFCQTICNRSTNETIDFYDMDWKHQEFTGLGLPYHNHSRSYISVPTSFEDMKKAATVLSKDIPFVRIDFYEVNKQMYFGEITFYPASGFGEFKPDKWNNRLGDLISLETV